MRSFAAVTAVLTAGLLLAGCAGGPEPDLTTPIVETALNTIPPAPPPGTIVVGVIGATIGLSLGEQDRQRGLSAEYQALEYGAAGVAVDWQGTPGVTGQVIPGPIYTVNEYECRDYAHTILLANGVTDAGRGTACRTGGGPWTPVP